MHRRALALVLALPLLAVPPLAGASVAVLESIESMSVKADLIVQGRVLDQSAAWTRGGRIITTVRIQVDDRIKGSSPEVIEVRHLGGRVGDIGQQVEGEVQFTNGEAVVLFLRARRGAPGAFSVVGLSQGKFSIRGSGPEATAAQDLGRLGTVTSPEAPIHEAAGQALPLRALRARAERALGRGGQSP